MKKFMFLPLMAILSIFAVSCSDDDSDLPDVSFTVEVGDDTPFIDGTIYVVQGEPLNFESISVKNNEQGKSAAVVDATYFFDGIKVGFTPVAPFGFEFNTTDVVLGSHTVSVVCTVIALDKTPATAVLAYNVKIVASADDIPQGSATATVTGAADIKPQS